MSDNHLKGNNPKKPYFLKSAQTNTGIIWLWEGNAALGQIRLRSYGLPFLPHSKWPANSIRPRLFGRLKMKPLPRGFSDSNWVPIDSLALHCLALASCWGHHWEGRRLSMVANHESEVLFNLHPGKRTAEICEIFFEFPYFPIPNSLWIAKSKWSKTLPNGL